MRQDLDLKLVWLAALAATVFYSLLLVFAYPAIGFDMHVRYAPMAEAFAACNWQQAFHPRFGLSFTCLTGPLVALTGMGGRAACLVVSAALWCFASVPLFAVLRRLFGRETAWWSVGVLLVAFTYLYMAGEGRRDTGRILGFAWMALGFVRTFRDPSAPTNPVAGSLWMAAGLLLTMTLKVDGIPTGSILLAVYAALCLRRRLLAALVAPVVAWALSIAASTLLVHSFTGHWLPFLQLIRFLGRWL